MWPQVDSTKRMVAAEQVGAAVAALPRADVVGDPGDHVGVDVDGPRSTGLPSTVAAPGVTERVATLIRRKSRCSAAGMRVVSAFQNSTSKAGGFLPSR